MYINYSKSILNVYMYIDYHKIILNVYIYIIYRKRSFAQRGSSKLEDDKTGILPSVATLGLY